MWGLGSFVPHLHQWAGFPFSFLLFLLRTISILLPYFFLSPIVCLFLSPRLKKKNCKLKGRDIPDPIFSLKTRSHHGMSKSSMSRVNSRVDLLGISWSPSTNLLLSIMSSLVFVSANEDGIPTGRLCFIGGGYFPTVVESTMFWGGLHDRYVSEPCSRVVGRESWGCRGWWELRLLSVEIGLGLLLSLDFASNSSEMENPESPLATAQVISNLGYPILALS